MYPLPELAVNVTDPPIQMVEAEAAIVAAGVGLTVTVVVTDELHPFAVTVYVIVVLPAATPVTTPVDASTVAVAVLLDVQTPPAVALVSAVVEPTHTPVVPLIAATVGSGLTVIT